MTSTRCRRRSCGWWRTTRRRPAAIKESLQYGGVFDDLAESYDARRSGYPSDLVATAVRLAGLDRGSRVVEVGAGTGKLTEELVACGLRVEAVDPGRNMIELARRRVHESELVRFHLGRFEDVSLPEGRFDAIFAASAFHWVDPSIGWAKAAALLHPGGTFALLQPIGVRDVANGEVLDELGAAFTRLAPELAAESVGARDEATILAGVDELRESADRLAARVQALEGSRA